MRLKYLVLHCSATPEGREISSSTIRHWHTDKPPAGRGWSQVGYSAMIHLDGQIEILVPYNEDDNVDRWEVTNGVAGINSVSRHIVYVGGTDKNQKAKDTRTGPQLAALNFFVKAQIAAHPLLQVAGHNQFAAKDCPSFDVPSWLRSIGIDEENIYPYKNEVSPKFS